MLDNLVNSNAEKSEAVVSTLIVTQASENGDRNSDSIVSTDGGQISKKTKDSDPKLDLSENNFITASDKCGVESDPQNDDITSSRICSGTEAEEFNNDTTSISAGNADKKSLDSPLNVKKAVKASRKNQLKGERSSLISSPKPEVASHSIPRTIMSPSECNGSSPEVNEDISIRSRYGRTHKPKPLNEGFLTTDRKVGAFLGHSPQSSPRKKDDSLRLSLKNHKKSSPVKISPGEKLKAALDSLKSTNSSIANSLTFKKNINKSFVNNLGNLKTPIPTNKRYAQKEVTPISTPLKRSRGRPPLSAKAREKSGTPEKPPKKLNKSGNEDIFHEVETYDVKEDSPADKHSHRRNLLGENILKVGGGENGVNGMQEHASDDSPQFIDEGTPAKMEFVDDDEAMVEKGSDSGVESSATAPPSEPEDNIQETTEKVDEKVSQPSPAEWLVGDLVWGHIKGHPFWPCIIIHEPEQGLFVKTTSLGMGRVGRRTYHVRFFGDNARRSWLFSKHILRFTGHKDYMKLIEEHADRKKDFEVATRNLLKWKSAIEEAEELLDLGRAERLEKFAAQYLEILGDDESDEESIPTTPRVSVKKSRKRPRPVSNSPSSSENESPQRETKVMDCEPVKSSRYRIKSRKVMQPMTPFDAFCEKHRERVVDEFPDLPSDGIEAVLHQRWEMLDDNVKSRYESHSNQGSQVSDKVSDDEDEAILVAETESVTSKDEPVPKSETKTKSRKSINILDSTKRKGLFRGVKPDKVCIQCEEPGGEVLKCRGPCCRFFHLKCAPENSKGVDGHEDFRCGNCVNGEMAPCNACWKKEESERKEGERKRCNQQGCGRCYHEECLTEWPQAWWSRQTFMCPAHCCHTCASDDPRDARMHTSQAEKLVRCIRCPATYHSGDFCLPAGCEILTGNNIICQRHYKTPKKGVFHVNTSWCFICSMGGSLICCDRCPSSFHPQCLNITAPEGSYICEDCDSARYPLYGEVVWVKLGRYRWWPAKILYPSEIPDNVKALPHSLGEFAVRFFGSHDHYWFNNGRAFLYQEGDSAKTAAPKNGFDTLFAKAMDEASISFKEYAKRKSEWEASNVAGRNTSSKPPRFVRIKTNKPVGDVKPFETVHASYTPCDCDPKTEKPCSQEPNCLNRMLMVECVPDLCRAGDRCCNQRFQKREYPPLSTCRTDGRGWGLMTLADIAQGDFVVEYVGEMINEAECHRRMERMHRLKDENYYFLTIDKDHILDAGPKGNLSRFMNHSCNPNCETQKWTVGRETRVGLFALHDIPAGTELTFNYNLQVIGTDRRPCLCGAPNCVRFIGAKNKNDPEETSSENTLTPSAKKTKGNGKTPKRPEKASKSAPCVTCGNGGELVYCSVKSCNKSYHSTCTEFLEDPKGKYTCPLHQCFYCGSKASHLCGECSNLFCQEHVIEKPSSKRGILCSSHVKKEILSTEESTESASDKTSEETVKGQLAEVCNENLKDGSPMSAKIPRRRSSAKGRLANES
ncbi:histone-lysine N-methyltransferase NSD2 [Ischnura elegans]|uniref:histone-lysine N-methyltransferase NSD2 n=1 Tax=Ischnura elegans TaxID=197161 RepID=UPI001ED881F0|nr:histone-lysine N-methyltransferase NSD2 [Ischnura elegans]XP_046382552.1 histone-lysine N-methyltransferase NSD2 [Ischnura elegans]